jgi:hypothetical protein
LGFGPVSLFKGNIMRPNNQAFINSISDKRIARALTSVIDAVTLLPITEALTATDATRVVYVVTHPCKLVAVSEAHTTASSSGTLTLEKLTGTTAPGSGTAMLTATISLAGTANTVLSGTPVSDVSILTLAAGDRLALKIAGTMTSLAGSRVSIMLAQV